MFSKPAKRGIKLSNAEMEAVDITGDEFLYDLTENIAKIAAVIVRTVLKTSVTASSGTKSSKICDRITSGSPSFVVRRRQANHLQKVLRLRQSPSPEGSDAPGRFGVALDTVTLWVQHS